MALSKVRQARGMRADRETRADTGSQGRDGVRLNKFSMRRWLNKLSLKERFSKLSMKKLQNEVWLRTGDRRNRLLGCYRASTMILVSAALHGNEGITQIEGMGQTREARADTVVCPYTWVI